MTQITEPIQQPAPTEPVVGNYFVAAYPPFSAWQPDRALVDAALRERASADPYGIYVHIPFCHRKCDYCYYLSYVGERPEVVDRYLETVIRELNLYAAHESLKDRSVSYIYFGGGTPSTLTERQILRLGERLGETVRCAEAEEITFECAPRTVRLPLLQALKQIGVTRISMGVQSFDDGLLKLNGRVHLRSDVYRAYALLREACFDVVNLDLMAGLLGETIEQWKETIQRAIDLGPDSITIYQTEIPYNTQLYRDLSRGCLLGEVVPWEQKRERLDFGFSELQAAGYQIQNAYSAVKDPRRNQVGYQQHLWQGGDMLGLGVASFSYFAGVHYQNDVTLEKYTRRIEQGELPVKRAYGLSPRDRLVRELIFQLKLGEARLDRFAGKFAVDLREAFSQPLARCLDQGWVTISDSAISLTSQGRLNADWLVRHFFDPQFQETRYT